MVRMRCFERPLRAARRGAAQLRVTAGSPSIGRRPAREPASCDATAPPFAAAAPRRQSLKKLFIGGVVHW